MKKLISIILAIAMLCPVLVGCGKSREEKIEDTAELTVYADKYLMNSLDAAFTAYQIAYPKVKLNVVDLSDLKMEEYRTKIQSEIQAGKGPDVIFMDSTSLGSVNKCIKAGAFCELDSLIKNDTKFKMSDYNQAIMNAGIFKNKRYVIPLCFEMPYLLTTQNMLDKTGIDITKCNDYLGFAGEIDNYIKKGDTNTRIFKNNYVLNDFYDYLGIDILNYEKNNVNLDNDKLKKTISLYKNFYPQDVTNRSNIDASSVFYELEGSEFLKQKRIVFEMYSYGSGADIFQNACSLKAAGEKPIMLPLRTVDGKAQAQVSLGAAIRNNSKNKKNAFDFIKVLLSDDIQNGNPAGAGLPGFVVKNSSVDVVLQKYKSFLASQPFASEGYLFEELPQDYYDNYKNVIKEIESCKLKDIFPGAYASISSYYLSGYLTPFYLGEKSYEDCIKNAKEQLQIYISE